MHTPRRFRLLVRVQCRGEWHRLGLTRRGLLVPLDHTPAELGRWRSLAELGGRPPACVPLAGLDLVEHWLLGRPVFDTAESDYLDKRCRSLTLVTYWARVLPAAVELVRACGRVVLLRALRASAGDSPGQGKRNRRREARGRPAPPPPPPPPGPARGGRRRRLPRAGHDLTLSLYRRRRKCRPGRANGVRSRVYYQDRDVPRRAL